MKEIFSRIDLNKLFRVERIFEIDPEPNGLYLYLAFIFTLLIIVAAVIAAVKILKKSSTFPTSSKLLSKWFHFCLIIGLAGLVLIFFRYQGIAYLGSRLMMIFLAIWSLIWVLTIIFYRVFTIPKESKIREEKERFEKYLPKKNNLKGNK